MSEDGVDLEKVFDLSSAAANKASGQIEKMGEVSRLTNDDLNARRLIYPGMTQREILNTFREVRTRLLQLSGGENFITIVTSVCAEGGGSFISKNLATAFALAENKTALIIDCNLYEPAVGDLLTIEPDYGLTDYLQNEDLNVEDIIYSSGIPRLRIIPVGQYREASVESFTTRRMQDFLVEVKKRYPDRYIILDVAPVGVSADARILLDYCDNALLVVPSGKVNRTQVLSSIDAIGQSKLAGVIFNDV